MLNKSTSKKINALNKKGPAHHAPGQEKRSEQTALHTGREPAEGRNAKLRRRRPGTTWPRRKLRAGHTEHNHRHAGTGSQSSSRPGPGTKARKAPSRRRRRNQTGRTHTAWKHKQERARNSRDPGNQPGGPSRKRTTGQRRFHPENTKEIFRHHVPDNTIQTSSAANTNNRRTGQTKQTRHNQPSLTLQRRRDRPRTRETNNARTKTRHDTTKAEVKAPAQRRGQGGKQITKGKDRTNVRATKEPGPKGHTHRASQEPRRRGRTTGRTSGRHEPKPGTGRTKQQNQHASQQTRKHQNGNGHHTTQQRQNKRRKKTRHTPKAEEKKERKNNPLPKYSVQQVRQEGKEKRTPERKKTQGENGGTPADGPNQPPDPHS